MTEPFGQESVPPQQDHIPPQSHVPGQNLSPNIYGETEQQIFTADSAHEALALQSRQISALMARLARYEQPEEVVSAPAGGAPIAHHLHLVDGRTVINHGGIGTHFSETLSDGSTRITRIKEYFPVVEPDPTTLYA